MAECLDDNLWEDLVAMIGKKLAALLVDATEENFLI